MNNFLAMMYQLKCKTCTLIGTFMKCAYIAPLIDT